jgi:hypothetical protein
MTFGLIIAMLVLTGIIIVLGILLFLRQSRGPSGMGRHAPNPSSGILSPDSPLQEIEIPKVPMYQKTKEPMANLRNKIDRLGDAFDIAYEKVRKETDGKQAHSVGNDLKEIHTLLQDARKASHILLATVIERPVDDIGISDENHEDQVITNPPPASPNSLRNTLFKTFATLRETIDESKTCIAGFYFALTKKDQSARIAEASGQIELLIILFDNALAKIRSLEDTL